MTDRNRWIALHVLCMGMLMIVLDATVVNVALPSIQDDLRFSQSGLAWVVNAYLIAFGGLLLLAGRLGDLISPAEASSWPASGCSGGPDTIWEAAVPRLYRSGSSNHATRDIRRLDRYARAAPSTVPAACQATIEMGKIMNDLQQQVQEAIDQLVESGAERGLQVAIYRHGQQMVDAVAGVADHETGGPVAPNTPFYAYSTGRGATATVAHVLVERGLFDYDTRIVELWPEFGAHGKEAANVRHVLTHTVGVPGIPADTTPEDLCDWDKMCTVVANAEPWWAPGTKTTYHAYTFGYIVGEIVRRATGKPISQVLREDVAEPLGVADELYFGVPESELGRLARLEDAEGSAEFLAAMPDGSPFFKWGSRATFPTAEFGNRADVLMADIPAGGKMSARAMARMCAALLGEVDGVRLISPERLREISGPAFSGEDQIMGNPVTWALGYAIGRIGTNQQETPTVFGIGGAGGSCAQADTATGTTFALTKNRLTPSFDAAEQVAGIVTKAVAES